MISIPKKTGITIQCEYCGKDVYKTMSQFLKREHHYCSNACQALKKRQEVFEYRACEICGSDMYISKKSAQRFCSGECQRKWQAGNTGVKNPKFEGTIITCEQCGKQYAIGGYRLRSGNRHFCSAGCRQEWYRSTWSQSEQWREESRCRAVRILKDNPVVTMTKPQLKVNALLEKMGIKYRNEEGFVYYSIDNYLPDYNLAVEVMGDYWHSSPIKYPDAINEKQRRIVGKDKAKRTFIRQKFGVEILYLWERDINENIGLCELLIDRFIKNIGRLDNYHSFNYIVYNGDIQMRNDLIIPYQEIAC